MSEVYYVRLSLPEQRSVWTGPCAIGVPIAVRCPRLEKTKSLSKATAGKARAKN